MPFLSDEACAHIDTAVARLRTAIATNTVASLTAALDDAAACAHTTRALLRATAHARRMHALLVWHARQVARNVPPLVLELCVMLLVGCMRIMEIEKKLGKSAFEQRFTAISKHAPQALDNEPEWMVLVGRCLIDGPSEPDDAEMRRAVSLFQRASATGLAAAQSILAGAYNDGEGVDKDCVKAFELFSLAAEQGHGVAALNLARILSDKDDDDDDDDDDEDSDDDDDDRQRRAAARRVAFRARPPVDESRAVEFYQFAVDCGCYDALVDLGWHYENGVGVARDFERALKLYYQAADGVYGCVWFVFHIPIFSKRCVYVCVSVCL